MTHGKIHGRAELIPVLEFHRAAGDRLIFTNGCFDLLHPGHLQVLEAAKAAGGILIVGVNDDLSVQWLKGPRRPVMPLAARLRLVAALAAVDYVVPLCANTPHSLLALIRPQLHVKGGDYTAAALPEYPLLRELGAEVLIVPRLETYSTTALIARAAAA